MGTCTCRASRYVCLLNYCWDVPWLTISLVHIVYNLMQVIVNNPTPKKNDKVDTFEDTMLLMSICKHKMELAKEGKMLIMPMIMKDNDNLTEGKENNGTSHGAEAEKWEDKCCDL